MVFDHAGRSVVSTLNNDPPQTFTIPDPVQDALSSLFYLRTLEDFTIGKIHVISVHDGGKNWSVEVVNKGEIFIWLTDDSRKIPVLMKSTISIGSIMTTLRT